MALEIDFSKPIDISKLKTAEDIKKVQQFLLDQNEPGGPKYNLGTTGDNKNGVDGALGSRTKKAIEQYNTWLAGENAKRAAEAQRSITPVSTTISTSATPSPTQVPSTPAKTTPEENTTKKEVVITSAPAQEQPTPTNGGNNITIRPTRYPRSEYSFKGGELVKEDPNNPTIRPLPDQEVIEDANGYIVVERRAPKAPSSENKSSAEPPAPVQTNSVPAQSTPKPAPTTPVEAAPQSQKAQKVVELPSSVEVTPTNVPANNPSSVEAPIDMQGTYVDPKVAEEIIRKSEEEGMEIAPAVKTPDTFDPMAYREAMRLQKASARRSLENDTSKEGEGEDTTENNTTEENPTAVETQKEVATERESLLQDLFDQYRKNAEKERTDQLALASYNSIGNALRSLAQPLGWWAGGSTANVQPYDRRAYLDAFNRAVAANNDVRNVTNKELEYQLNRAEWDRRQAQTLDDYEKKKEIEKNTQLAIIQARSDAAIKTLQEKAGLGGGKDLYSERLTNAVQGWIIHGGQTPLAKYLDGIEAATPGYFGDKRPSASVIKQVEDAADKASATTKGGASGASGVKEIAGSGSNTKAARGVAEILKSDTLPNDLSSAEIRSLQEFLVNKGYNLGTSGANKNGVDGGLGKKTRQAWDYYKRKITADDLSILEKWQSVDPTPDTPFTDADMDTLKARKKTRPNKRERRAYESAWAKVNPDKVEKKGQGHKAFGI